MTNNTTSHGDNKMQATYDDYVRWTESTGSIPSWFKFNALTVSELQTIKSICDRWDGASQEVK